MIMKIISIMIYVSVQLMAAMKKCKIGKPLAVESEELMEESEKMTNFFLLQSLDST